MGFCWACEEPLNRKESVTSKIKSNVFYKDYQLSYLRALKIGHNFREQNGDICSLEKRCLNENCIRSYSSPHYHRIFCQNHIKNLRSWQYYPKKSNFTSNTVAIDNWTIDGILKPPFEAEAVRVHTSNWNIYDIFIDKADDAFIDIN